MTARAKHHASGAPHREDRRDSHEVDQPLLLSEGGAVLAVVERSSARTADGSTTLGASRHRGTHSAAAGAARASAFLVAPDLVVTAGSWTGGSGLRDHVLLFGYEVVTQGTTRTVFLPADVHVATEVVACSPGDGTEWAVLRLASAAVGRLPLSVRRTGRIAVGEPLHVIGHPGGSPRKTVLGLRAVGRCGPGSFVIDLEPFGGDCGAPVISTRSHLVEGVLVAGCGAAPPGRRGTGERVTCIDELVQAIPSGARPHGPGAGDASATAR